MEQDDRFAPGFFGAGARRGAADAGIAGGGAARRGQRVGTRRAATGGARSAGGRAPARAGARQERARALRAMSAAAVLDRRVEDGVTVELVQRGDAYDVLVEGRRVMRSDARRAEKQLVELALAPLGQRDDITVVLAGLGMGFTLRALLDAPGVERVDVVEASRAVVEWEARHFAGLNGDALKDPRVTLHAVDLATFVKGLRTRDIAPPAGDGWLALVLDMDEGPALVSRPGNEAFYDDEG